MRYETISARILNKLIDENKISSEYREIYAYTLEKLLAGIGNAILLILMAIIFQITIETIVFIAFYMPIRKYAGGLHASTRKRCVAISLILIVSLIKLSIYISSTYGWIIISLIILIAALILIFQYAPVDNDNKKLSPDDKKQYRKKAKRIALAESFIILIGLLIIPNQKVLVMTAAMSILLVAITLIPYKIIMEGLYYEENEQKV